VKRAAESAGPVIVRHFTVLWPIPMSCGNASENAPRGVVVLARQALILQNDCFFNNIGDYPFAVPTEPRPPQQKTGRVPTMKSAISPFS
jgi:hypothetical protein